MSDSNENCLHEKTVESVVHALDGEDVALFSYLPYLLQDLWEIGASTDVILELIRKQGLDQHSDFHVLDLGCGKGAVSIPLAKEFGFQVYGMDAMPAFIEEARDWAEKYGVSNQCQFEVGDIRQNLHQFKNMHLLILGSIGPVLGNVEQTLIQVKMCLAPDGFVILDDGYVPDNSSLRSEIYLTEIEIKKQIQNAGFSILDCHKYDREFMRSSDQEIYHSIEKRANELMEKHPEKQDLFQGYLDAQSRENEILENEIVCVTYLLKRM